MFDLDAYIRDCVTLADTELNPQEREELVSFLRSKPFRKVVSLLDQEINGQLTMLSQHNLFQDPAGGSRIQGRIDGMRRLLQIIFEELSEEQENGS